MIKWRIENVSLYLVKALPIVAARVKLPCTLQGIS
jgi:hypothetical protein